MNLLPTLEIEEDLEKLRSDSDNEDNEEINIIVDDLTQNIEISKPRDIFIGKPTNNLKNIEFDLPEKRVIKNIKKPNINVLNDIGEPIKKPLSDKQRAHLEKIRVKAIQSKKDKAELKREVKKRVESEVRRERAKLKAISKPTLIKPTSVKSIPVKPIPVKPIPVKPIAVKPIAVEQIPVKLDQLDEQAFMKFMTNMEKYKVFSKSYKTVNQGKLSPRPKTPPPSPQPKKKEVLPVKLGEGDLYACNFMW